MLALLDESHPRWRDVADLAHGLAVETIRALFEPGDRPLTTYALVVGLRAALGIAFVLPAVATGFGARYWLGELPRLVGFAGQLVWLVAFIAFCGQSVRRSIRLTSGPGELDAWTPPFSRGAGTVWLSAWFIGVLLAAWGPDGGNGWLSHLMIGVLASQQLASWPWAHVMHRAIHQLARSKHELKWARMEFERCEGLAAAGAAAPLAEARDAIVRIDAQRDEAIATLHAMGYRARVAGTVRTGHDSIPGGP
jgi:hypothetical protein